MSLASYIKQEYDNYLSRCIVDGVKEAVWPWQTNGIALLLDYDIVDMHQNMIVEVYFRGISDWLYAIKQPLPDRSEPEETVALVVQSFTDSFRSWRQEPEPHIILGEN